MRQLNQEVNQRKRTSSRKKKRSRKKRRAKLILTFEILLILVLIAGGVYYYNFSKLQNYDLDKGNIAVNDFKDENIKDYYTFVLYGVDSQTNQLAKGNRSDSIIIASINKKTKKVKLLSVYRDTYSSVEGHGFTKINHAYSYGGPELSLSTINRNFDLNAQQFVTVNFKSLANVVDLLGGIELDIQKEEMSNLNAYIGNMNKINGGNSPKIKNPGKQTLDGNQAVAYARIRYTAGGDLRRAERQRIVVGQILAKAKKSNPVTISKIIDEMFPQILTSFSSKEVLFLAKDLLSYEIEDSQGFPFDNKGAKINGVYYGLPVTLESNVIKMHKYLYGTENYTPSDTVKEISKSISGN